MTSDQPDPIRLSLERPKARTLSVGAIVRVDVRGRSRLQLVAAAKRAASAPDGARVELTVAPGARPDAVACAYLREHGRHLAGVAVACSDVDTIRAWVKALTYGARGAFDHLGVTST